MNELIVSFNNTKKKLSFASKTKVIYNGEEFDFEIFETVNNEYFLRIAEKLYNFTCGHINNENIVLFSSSEKFELTIRTLLQEKASEVLAQRSIRHHLQEIKAPMPGMILKIKKSKGEEINHGEAVLILEAMKMENEIRSASKGIIKEIYVREGNAVEKGTKLFLVED
jgi:biotin carboxyl carrier protein